MIKFINFYGTIYQLKQMRNELIYCVTILADRQALQGY